MDYYRHRDPDLRPDSMTPMELLGLVLKIGAFLVFVGVGLKLTFWALNVVDEILHRPHDVAVLRPLLERGEGSERTLAIEHDENSVTFRDHNAGSLFLLGILLLVLFSAIGRAIAALFGGAVRLLASHEFKRRAPPPVPPVP
jgi:hypothetical protein